MTYLLDTSYLDHDLSDISVRSIWSNLSVRFTWFRSLSIKSICPINMIWIMNYIPICSICLIWVMICLICPIYLILIMTYLTLSITLDKIMIYRIYLSDLFDLVYLLNLSDLLHDLFDPSVQSRWSTSLSIWSICPINTIYIQIHVSDLSDLDHDPSDLSVRTIS